MKLSEEIEKKLREDLGPDCEIYLKDLTGEGNHFELFAVSPSFEGKNKISRQQRIHEALSEIWKAGALHALTMKIFTPVEWKELEN